MRILEIQKPVIMVVACYKISWEQRIIRKNIKNFCQVYQIATTCTIHKISNPDILIKFEEVRMHFKEKENNFEHAKRVLLSKALKSTESFTKIVRTHIWDCYKTLFPNENFS